MNYAGKFDGAFSSEGAGNHSHFVQLNPGHVHAPADSIVIPDAHFLFNADFKRSGVDLVLSKGDHELVLHDYFKGENHKALAAPDGAHLTGALVDALTGHVDIAQAGGGQAAASAVIGHVTKLAGSATVVRNGVSIILNMGDNVEKGDVVQSGANTTLGLTFIDGTVFGLSSNARMVLNEMVYDPNGSNNSSLLSLVAGTITFVAGETAKHGDMKIDTPVATMGIRGTAVLVEIDFSTTNASFQVLVEPDGTTGSYILFDKTTLQPLAIVNQAGQQININNGVISQTQNPLTPEMQKLINEVFTQKFTDNSSTKSTTTIGSSSPDGTTALLKFSENLLTVLTGQNTTTGLGGPPPPNPGPSGPGPSHVPGGPTVATVTAFAVAEIPGKTSATDADQIIFRVGFSDINPGDRPTARSDFSTFTYKDAQGHDVTASLNALQKADIAATETALTLTPDPNNTNNGNVDVVYSLADKNFDFLAAGETLTLTYTITVNTNYAPDPEATSVQVAFTIVGTNDTPVIANHGTQLVHFAAGTATSGGNLLTADTTGGTYSFKDPDLTDKHWIIDPNKDPKLNPNANPADPHRFDSIQKGVLTSASMAGPNGTLGLADLQALAPESMSLLAQALDVNVSTDSTGTGNGQITWQLENLPVFVADFIPPGETLKLFFTIELTDEQGSTDTKIVEVDIAGTNDAATVWVHTTDDGHDNNWTTGANWSTGRAPTSLNDAIIVTDSSHPGTPAYPATITTGTNAAARSVVLNDLVGSETENIPPVLEVDSGASLTIVSELDLGADSVLNNFGTINVGTKLELLNDASNPVTPVNRSVVNNSGTINIAQGGDIQGQASVTNSGTIELQGGTLNLDVNIANSHGTLDFGANVENSNGGSGGTIRVDSGAKLVLGTDSNPDLGTPSQGGVTGGTVIVNGGGELDFTGGNTLSGGMLSNDGQVNVTGSNNVLTAEQVLNTGTASAIDIMGTLTAQSGTTIANQDATSGETIESGGTLTLKDTSSISGGQLTNMSGGTVNLQGSSGVSGVAVSNAGTMNLSGTSSLSNGSLANSGTINVSGTGNKFDNETVTANNMLEVLAGAVLTLDQGTSIANANGTVEIDSTATLTLNNAGITNGSVTNAGTINSAGGGSINQADINNTGTIESTSGTLTIDPAEGLQTFTLTNSGTVKADSGQLFIIDEQIVNTGTLGAFDGGTLKLTSLTVTNADGTVQIDDGASLVLDGATIHGGTVNNGTAAGNDGHSGGIEIKSSSTIDEGAALNYGIVTIDAGQTLTLNDVTVTGTTFADTAMGATLTVDGGSTLDLIDVTVSGGTLSGTGTIETATGNVETTLDGVTIASGTTVHANFGILDLTGTITADGAAIDASATVDLDGVTFNGGAGGGSLSGSGVYNVTTSSTIDHTALNDIGITIASGQTLTLTSDTVLGGTTISFAGADDILKIDSATSFDGTIADIAEGDTLDLTTTTVTAATFDGNVVTVTDNNGLQTTYQIADAPAGDTFWFKSDGATGTNLVVLPNTLTLAPVAETGVEGSPIALDLGVAISGTTDSLAKLIVSAIPIGATLSDGHGHSFTATDGTGHQQVDVHTWNLSSLTITPPNDTNFTLTVAVTEQDTAGYLSTTTTSTEGVTVDPTSPVLTWAAGVTGVETHVALGNLTDAITGFSGDANTVDTLTIFGAPAGAVLSDGHGHHATSDGINAIDIRGWTLSSLSVETSGAAVPDGNFTLTATATEKDAEGNISAPTTATEVVTMNPTAPVLSWSAAVSGTETRISLGNLVETITSQPGDSNSANTLTISGAPQGVVLSDGHGHTATSDGSSPIDVSAWHLSSLTADTSGAAVPDGNFTLTATATEIDGEGNVSGQTTAKEHVTVNPTAPTVTPVAVTVVEGQPIALNLGLAVTSSEGDTNSLNAVTIGSIPAGATLSNTNGDTLTISGGSITFNAAQLAAGVLNGLKITPASDANFTLNISAQEKDAEGDLSTTTSNGEQVTVNPTPPTVTWSPSPASGTEGAAVALTLTVTPTGGPGDVNAISSLLVNLTNGATISDGTQAHTVTAIQNINHDTIDILGWNLNNLTVTPANGSTFTLTATAIEKDVDNDVSTATTATETIHETAQFGYLWGTTVVSRPGSHLFNPIISTNPGSGTNTGALIFGTAPSSGFLGAGPDTVTESVGLFDPFGLPYRSGIQTVQSSTTDLPILYNVIMPVAASGPEAIAFYSTESGGVSTIHQQIISESANGPNGSLTVGAPTTLEANLSGGVTSLFDGFTNIKSDLSTSSSLTSYDIAWATYNTSTHTYQAQFQIFPTGGNPAAVATLIAPVTLASPASAPAWEFRNAGSLSDHAVSVPYASVIAVADSTHVGQHDVLFQGYNVDGSANPDVHFQIAPDLSAFQPGATNQIIQPTNGTSLMFTPNGVVGSGFSVAWSETVTDSAGTHNQVEFAIFKASGFNAAGTFGSGQLVSQTTFQVPDAQNIRVGSVTLGGASFEFLAYGDGTSTTVIEFDQTGHQVASITDTAHNGVTFSDLAVLGDGRIALSYADGAQSQFTTDVFDLRQSGLNNPVLSNPNGNYVAGTHFTDSVTGGNGVNNFYAFIGSSSGTPTDTFTGGTGNSFNEALFTDARSSFAISLNGNTASVVSHDGAHGGTLGTSNVQALAFGTSQDPTPSATGGLEVTAGETLVMLGNFQNGNTYPVTIDAGGTLEIMAANSAETATFSGAATLQLDQSHSFTGAINGFSAGSTIDLSDVAYQAGEYAVWTQGTGAQQGGGTLTVYDASGHAKSSLHLNGVYTPYEFAVASDGASGTPGTDITISNDFIAFNTGQVNANANVTPQISASGDSIVLTDGHLVQASTWFASSKVSITHFTASFDYQATGSNPADGAAFILQNSPDGAHARGAEGAFLGFAGISPSAAVEFSLYQLSGVGTAFATDGETFNYTPTGNVHFESGDQIQVVISYDGSVLTESLTDLVNGAVYTAHYTVDLTSVLGGTTAYVGFSGATGEHTSTQTISNFTYSSDPSPGAFGASDNVGPVISANGSLEIDSASSQTITFAADSGTLVLDDPQSFTGKIAGMSGTDALDLHGFAAASTTGHTGNGSYDLATNTTTLTVTDSSDNQTETFKLAGDLSNSSWSVSDDGQGFAKIIDPPASSGQPLAGMIMHDPGPAVSQTIVATAPNQTLTGTAANDTFVFNFKGVGSDTVTDFHPGADALQFAQSVFGNAQAAFDASHDDGHGSAVIDLDAHDSVVLGGIAKAQLHVGDFHVV